MQPGLPDLLDPAADLPDLEAVRVLRAALRALVEVSMRGRPPPASALRIGPYRLGAKCFEVSAEEVGLELR
jgi:hypothetical protein